MIDATSRLIALVEQGVGHAGLEHIFPCMELNATSVVVAALLSNTVNLQERKESNQKWKRGIGIDNIHFSRIQCGLSSISL